MKELPSSVDQFAAKFASMVPHLKASGVRIESTGGGTATMVLPARPEWLGDPQRGLLHPGPITMLADSACGISVALALGRMQPYATLDLRMDWLRPAVPGLDVTGRAECYRLTRNVAFTRGTVWQSDEDQPVASVHAAFMLSTPSGRPRGDGAGELAQAPAPAAWAPPPVCDPLRLDREVPYVEFLGLRAGREDGVPLFRMPFQERLIGNPVLPALHGGVVAGFAETAAILHLIETLPEPKFPKGIDFSIDYLRSGRPEDTWARCETVRVGSRVALVQVRCWQSSPDYPIAVARAHLLLAEPADQGHPLEIGVRP